MSLMVRGSNLHFFHVGWERETQPVSIIVCISAAIVIVAIIQRLHLPFLPFLPEVLSTSISCSSRQLNHWKENKVIISKNLFDFCSLAGETLEDNKEIEAHTTTQHKWRNKQLLYYSTAPQISTDPSSLFLFFFFFFSFTHKQRKPKNLELRSLKTGPFKLVKQKEWNFNKKKQCRVASQHSHNP